ncbi:PH domain-containing protein [Mycoplasmatota bacterium]|nr:PH domain-containing protein [Mycoplasmatota bacterium]
MKKVTLLNDEKIIYKIKFSIRIFFIDILFIMAIMSITAKIGQSNKGSIFIFILLFVFILLLIKTLLDFYRIFFHRVYISNFRVIYVKGYFLKRIKFYPLNKITGVYFRSNFFDRAKNMTSFKITLNDNQEFVLKNIHDGTKIADLLSLDLIKQHQENQRK